MEPILHHIETQEVKMINVRIKPPNIIDISKKANMLVGEVENFLALIIFHKKEVS
ncbi:MAG: hypothetical protein WA092_00820 [Minisyncoccales bacterium]